jgi:hypothetical protein
MGCIYDRKIWAPYLGLGQQLHPQTTYTNTLNTKTNQKLTPNSEIKRKQHIQKSSVHGKVGTK